MADAKEIVYDPTYMALLDGTDEPITDDFDPDAEYNRPAPPIEDGWYYGKAVNAGVYNAEGDLVPFKVSRWKNETKDHYQIGVKVEIVSADPLYNGKHVYTPSPSHLRTAPDPDRNNASGVSAAFRAMSGEPIKGMSEKEHAKQLVELLLTEPMVKVRVQNVLADRDAEKAARDAGEPKVKPVYGQRKIMALKGGTNAQGKFSGAADHPTTKVRCVARAVIQEFKAKDSDQAVKE
jgi:hypothetical protein